MLPIKHNKEPLGKGLETRGRVFSTHPTAFSRHHLVQLKENIKRITYSLEKEYGIPRHKKGDPLDILIQTILSQNTNDRNRDQAYQALKTRFPYWEDVLKASTRSLTQAIRTGGLAEQKARRIRQILKWIKKREGELSLLFLKKMNSEEIKKTLEGLKGIGPKTVHCLLLFGMGRDAFPVDTHVLRVGNRMGFIPDRMDAEKAHQWMVPLIPKGKSLSLHLNLIRFGRTICRAKNPQCHDCFLVDECSYWHYK
jgi:endonuclease-3